MRAKKSFGIIILGQRWRVKFWGHVQYARHIARDSVAQCHIDDREIHFNMPVITLQTVMHELAHAYVKEMSFVELQLDADQWEEFFCELISKHSQAIVDQAKEIYSKVGA